LFDRWLYERATMRGVRTLLHRHRALAALALAFMLAVRMLMPPGFMLAPDAKVLTVVICTGVIGEHQTAQLVIPQTEQKPGHGADKSDPCPYSGLSMAATAGADVPLLATALAFILALGFAAIAAIQRERAPYLRPPSRGPPVLA
jgi:hypothetical protein